MKKAVSIFLTVFLLAGCLYGCGTASDETAALTAPADIEAALDLSNNSSQNWTYDSAGAAWTLAIVSAVANPQIADEQGVSVCVPGAYVKGIDTDGDGGADISAASATSAVKGQLVIDYEAAITSSNGQVYTAATAPVIINTGAAGYSSQTNQLASASYAAEGYINVACGNRGKQDTVTTSSGSTVYTGDSPACLVDQKNAVRFVKYNIMLGNLPGNTECFVSTGGSGGGAFAVMLAATSNNSDYYPYEAACGAVGVYKQDDGSYTTSVTIDDQSMAVSDGVWGCVAYSAITSLAQADMAMAFEYYLDTDYDFNSSFQQQLAAYLSAEYMDYINSQNLTVAEAAVGFDLNADGDTADTIALTIKYDATEYAATNGYGGSYLTLYLDEFVSNLQWYIDNLDYAENWTWFDESGTALSDAAVADMTMSDKAEAFIQGRYAKTTAASAGPGGGSTPPSSSGPTGGNAAVGTPSAGTTQAAGSNTDSSNYSTFEEMLAAYQADIAEIQSGDSYGNNIVDLYDPLNYIGAATTENPAWSRIVMGAAEGDMSMLASLNLQISWLAAGTDAVIEWQWDGSHVPSEILGDSLALYVDEMYGRYVAGAVEISKPAASIPTANGTATASTGTDISSWVDAKGSTVSFSLAAAVSYRTAHASKATPGFDVIDYGQEDYVLGSSTADARHWDQYVLKVLQTYADTLSGLFNKG